MRNKQNKHLGLEIDPELNYKLHYIADYVNAGIVLTENAGEK